MWGISELGDLNCFIPNEEMILDSGVVGMGFDQWNDWKSKAIESKWSELNA